MTNLPDRKDVPCGAKLRKRDVRMYNAPDSDDGKNRFRVYDISRDRTVFGPAPWKDCIAWRKEHTA